MKKQILLIIVMLLVTTSAFAVEVEINGLWYEVISKLKEAKVIQYKDGNKYSGNIVIPETVEYEGVTFNVTSIGAAAFRDCYSLTSITIGKNVTSIGNSVFWYCHGLTSVTFSNSLKSIGIEAFHECRGLKSVYITSIEAWCKISFERYDSNPLCYASHLFLNGEEINNLVIPNSITSIGNYAFYCCKSLTSITIPNSITTIGTSSFQGCSSLTSVHIFNIEAWCKISFSDNPLIYAHHLFLNGKEIKELAVPNSVTSIGDLAFSGCRGLTSVKIPNSVMNIGSQAFQNCNSLIFVSIPNSVTNIGSQAFSGCTRLNSVTIPNSLTIVSNFAFYGCSSLTSITIPNNVTTIGNYAFSECSSLTKIIIGSGTKTIYQKAFANCSDLTDVYCYAEDVPCIKSGNQPCTDAFEGSYIEYATLHVSDGSINSYKESEPWKNFKNIVKIELSDFTLTYIVDEKVYKIYQIEEGASITPEVEPIKEGYTFSGWSEIPEAMPAHDVIVTGMFTKNIIDKCATPTIAFVDGKVTFCCETEDVEYVSNITPPSAYSSNSGEVRLSTIYKVTVYATKDGYENSDTATMDIDVSGGTSGIRGDVNLDNEVGMPDVMFIVQKILNGKFPDE